MQTNIASHFKATAVLSYVDVIVLNAMQSVAAVLSDVDVFVLNDMQSVTALLSDVDVIQCSTQSIRC